LDPTNQERLLTSIKENSARAAAFDDTILNQIQSGYRLEGDETEYLHIPIGKMTLAALHSRADSRKQLESDARSIELANQPIHAANQRVLSVLEPVSGQVFGEDRQAWTKWWADTLGFVAYNQSISDKPEFVQQITPDVPSFAPLVTGAIGNLRFRHSCFGRSTMVQTRMGNKRIESVKVGDLVLSCGTTNGTLSYQPVVAIHHNPPAETLKIDLGSDTIVATGIHRLWKTGKGWVMVRDLRPGDILRTVGGTVEVKSVTAEKVQSVFNLEVAEGHDFFVGKSGVLAHDNSIIKPVTDPFDARPELAAVREK